MCETSGEGGIRQRTGFYPWRGIDRCGRHDAKGLEGTDSLSRLESARTWLSCTERILRLGPSFRRNESVCALFFGARQNGEALVCNLHLHHCVPDIPRSRARDLMPISLLPERSQVWERTLPLSKHIVNVDCLY